MSEKIVVSDEDITKCIKYLIETAPPLKVDDDGYIISKSTGDKVQIEVVGDEKDTKVFKPIMVYKGVIPEKNVAILNPFIEGITRSDTGEWFYDIITGTVGNMVRMIQKALLLHTLESTKTPKEAKETKKEKKGKKAAESTETTPTPTIDMQLVGIVSRWVDKVDETTISEFEQLTKKISNYFTVRYFVTSKEARVTCGIINNEDFKIAHKRIRQKTWDVITDQLKYIFNTENFDEYFVKTKSVGCPKLDATLKLLLRLYTVLNPYMKYLPDTVKSEMNHEVIDLLYLSNCIDLLDIFKKKSSHIALTVPPPAGSTLVNPLKSAIQTNSLGLGMMASLKPVGMTAPITPLGTPKPGEIQKPSAFGVISMGVSVTQPIGSLSSALSNANKYGGW